MEKDFLELLYLFLNNEAYEAYRKGRYRESLNLFLEASKVAEEILGKEHESTATSYNNLGGLYKTLGEYEKAKEYYKKALKIKRKVLGEEHESTATSYNNLGSLYDTLGEYEKAKEYYEKDLKITLKILGEEHESTATSYNNLGLLYFKLGEYEKAYGYIKKSFDIYMSLREKAFSYLSTREKISFSKSSRAYLENFLDISYSCYMEKKDIVKEIYKRWILYKGGAFESENILSLIYERADKSLKKEIDPLKNKKTALASLYQKKPQDMENENYRAYLKKLENEIEEIEKSISQKQKNFKDFQELKDIDIDYVFDAMKEDELYLDFAKTKDSYYLFILDKEDIFLKKIENAKEIDTLSKEIREEIYDLIESLKRDEFDEDEILDMMQSSSYSLKRKLSILYYNLIKKPLEGLLDEKDSILVSGDSALFHIPFEILYDEENEKYLLERKDISYISSSKELVRLYKNQKERLNNPTLFIDPDLEGRDSIRYENRGYRFLGFEDEEEQKELYNMLSSMRFSKLSRSKEEGEYIKSLFNDSLVFEKNSFNEENLFKVNSPKFLHLSTHGFFISSAKTFNPMLKSGIVVSGEDRVNAVLSLKLMGLELQGTELVVISTCESGVGDIEDGEGVASLSSAFVKAGAKNVVMSLWEVSEDHTVELMKRFYKNRKDGLEYKEALKQAKLSFLEEKDPINSHIVFWSPFVLSGR